MTTGVPRPGALIQSNTIIRPADTTAYASGDLVANSVTAGSVVPFTFAGAARQAGYRSIIKQVGLIASQKLLTNASFRLHLLTELPTLTSGDNAALELATKLHKYLGFVDVALTLNETTQGSAGWGYPPMREIGYLSTSLNLFGLLEARAAYVPASAQTFKVLLGMDQF